MDSVCVSGLCEEGDDQLEVDGRLLRSLMLRFWQLSSLMTDRSE